MGPDKVDVIVIGAGISGLCVAYWAAQAGHSVRVMEKDSEVGGTMKSAPDGGFLSESGPNSALETTPLFKELISVLRLESEFLYASPAGKKRYVLREGNLHPLPLSPWMLLGTGLFSTSAKLRLLKEPFIGRAAKEESVAEFVTRRLGREFLDYAIDPFVAGVYAARPETLSVRSAFPKLYALEERYGGLIKGMLRGRRERKKRAETAKDRAESFSFVHGMQVLPNALARALGDRVVLNAKVTAIQDLTLTETEPPDEPGLRRYRVEYLKDGHGEEVESDAVVVAAPAFSAAGLLAHFAPSLAQQLRSIAYSPVVSVFLGFRSTDIGRPLDGFGFLVPSIEKKKILGCLWSSSLFPQRSPLGQEAFTVFVGGGRQPELTDLPEDELLALVMDELKSIMQIQGKPVYLRVTRWRRAIPQYELEHEKKVSVMEDFEEQQKGLFLCSNYRGGISVGDCVMSARSTVDRVTEFLKRDIRSSR